jgi:general secretion pathway protein M
MKLRFNTDRSSLVVGFSIGLALLLVIYCVVQCWSLRQSYVSEIEAIEPRTARLLGIMEKREDLESASREVLTQLQALTYPLGQDSATTAAGMQQEVRDLMSSAGLSISGSQILPTRLESGFEILGLDITAEGNTEVLDDALSGLQAMRPVVFVESVLIKPSRGRRRASENADEGDPRRLTVRFRLLSLKLLNQ